MRKIPAECKDAFGVAVSALRKLGKTDVAIDAVMKVDRVHLQAQSPYSFHAHALVSER